MIRLINSNIENKERGLLPYPIILAANNGEIEAMNNGGYL